MKLVGTIDAKVVELLELSIAPGTPIYLSDSNIEHMKKEHPADFEKYFTNLEDILNNPDFVTINPGDNSIRYIKRISELVHVGIRVSNRGTFFARTLFRIGDWKIDQYKTSGNFKEYK